jgi:hypothetical protein
MARIHGKRGQVKIDPTGGATPVLVASLNEWSLDMSKDRVDVTSFGDTNKQTVLGLPAYSGTFGGFWDEETTPAEVMAVILGDIAAMLQLIPDSASPTFLFSGLANLDGSIKASATGAVTIAGKFDAAGPWSMEPAIPPAGGGFARGGDGRARGDDGRVPLRS